MIFILFWIGCAALIFIFALDFLLNSSLGALAIIVISIVGLVVIYNADIPLPKVEPDSVVMYEVETITLDPRDDERINVVYRDENGYALMTSFAMDEIDELPQDFLTNKSVNLTLSHFPKAPVGIFTLGADEKTEYTLLWPEAHRRAAGRP